LRRQIIQISHGILTESYANYSLELTPFKFIEKAEEQLFKIATETTSSSSQIFKSFTHSLRDVIKQVQKAKEKGGLSGIETGFTEINRYIHGWQPSDLIIVAGRPSMGKTSFAIGVAINAAHAIVKEREQLEKQIFEAKIAQNISEEDARSEAIKESITKAGSIGVFSLEMSADQLTTRILAVETGLDTNWLVGGTVDDIQMRQIVDTAKNLEDLPIFIDETPAVTIAQIRTRARRLKRRFGLKLLVIDYLQLIKGGNSENRVQEISAITQGLKAIAKELNIPIIALSQLSRNVESRDDKRPQLSDLRESGSIEQDADIVMFLYRDSYYLERTRPEGDEDLMRQWEEKNGAKLKKVKNKAEIIIAKHRNGPIGTAVLKFDEDTTKFENFTATEEKYYIN
jgi:replicative DNA helicase